ncbi:MAG TPA: hypothetical protein VIS05_05285 [Ilumatobacter sp.]
MNIPLLDREDPPTTLEVDSRRATTRRRRGWMMVAGVAVAAAVTIATAAFVGDDGGDDSQVAGPPLELSLGDGSVASSCIMFDVAYLADMSPAFAATATAVDGEVVTLDVDRWYAGGDASTVTLTGAAGSPALIDGFEFAVGEQYLITAADGTVNFCGYSGPATPELTAAFDAAFPG